MPSLMSAFLLVAATGFIWALVGVVFSFASRQRLHLPAFMFVSSSCNALYAWLFLFEPAQWEAARNFPTFAMIGVMALAGALGAIGFLLMGAAMRKGHRGVVWALGQCAMLFPLLTAVACFGERPSAANWAGVGAVLVGMGLLALRQSGPDNSARPERGWLWMAYAVFLVVGASLTLTTLPSHWAGFEDRANLRLPVMFSASALLLLGPTAVAGFRSLALRTLLLGVLYSTVVFVGQVFLYRSLDAFVPLGRIGMVYPTAIGLCVALFSLYSVVFLKERLRGVTLAGLALMAVGILLLAANG